MPIVARSVDRQIPISPVTAEEIGTFIGSCSIRDRTSLMALGYDAKPHQHALLFDAEGQIDRVVVGVSSMTDLYALSSLPFALPRATYRLAEESRLAPYAAALSWRNGEYQFARYKKSPKPCATLVMPDSVEVQRANAMADAMTLARDLVNTPTEDMGPADLAAVAHGLAAEFGGGVRECIGMDLLKENFPAIHAVGRASHRPPRLIELTWGEETHPGIALVGKGVCFDTGGLDIKSAENMRQMKKDMGGAAHALALAKLVMQARLPVRLQMLIPAVENAISGNAYRPGEIVSSRAGLKLEIGNTDAEGRVILCDALALAAESKPQLILDFATLTGAARVALGPELPAVFANDEAWFEKLQGAAQATADPLWRMPLWQPYHEMIKSTIGDIVNTGGPQAGAITAALFLERFIPKGQAWVHIDLFASNLKAKPGRPEGGEAQTLRACFAMLEEAFR